MSTQENGPLIDETVPMMENKKLMIVREILRDFELWGNSSQKSLRAQRHGTVIEIV